MFPSVGDLVKFTDNFLNNSPFNWTSLYRGVELEVMNTALISMSPNPIYAITVMGDDGVMLGVNVDKNGMFIDPNRSVATALIVFEDYTSSSSQSYGGPVYGAPPTKQVGPSFAWDPTSVSVPKSAPTEDDRCKKCGTMGDVRGMCCTCPSCHNVIWGA